MECPHHVECGACAMIGAGRIDQLRRKRGAVGHAMRRYRTLRDVRLLETLPSPVGSGYRNRARMAVGLPREGGAELGYFRAGTREVVDAPDCGVLVPELLDTTRRIRAFLNARRDIPRELRHVDVRCGTDPGRQHLILVFRAKEAPRFPLEALRKKVPAVDGISINLNPTSGPQVIRGAIRHVSGEREVWVQHAGLDLRVSPASFFQVNLSLLPDIHRLMDGFLTGGELLFDLYAGVGTHGFVLGGKYRRVLFAEGTRAAVADLKATAKAIGRDDIEVSAVAVERSLDRLKSRRPDAVVLNPSRAGALEPVLETIGRSGARQVVYLSCDPNTLCRDLDVLVRHGYEAVSVRPIDMMPQTKQVEALALLRRRR